MNRYLQIEPFATDFPMVSFYTIRLEDAEFSETEKFINRFSTQEEFKTDLSTIIAWVEKMGKDLGARRIFFRDEDGANALPPQKRVLENFTPEFVEFAHLRLYCIRVSDQVVILLNGGVKTSQKVQDSPDCIAHFRLAVRFCKLLDEQMRDGGIVLKGKKLAFEESGFYF